MLKQVFDREQLAKTITPSDVCKWHLLSNFLNVEAAIDNTIKQWNAYGILLEPLNKRRVKEKLIFTPNNMEDAFAIKLLDRFIRKIYKIRQSDRNRIVRQLSIILKDSGDYNILRVDIKDCYETICLNKVISKIENDLILSYECIELLKKISRDLCENHNVHGIPRGLSISPTLAELYLENIDRKIASHSKVLYSARYVDDIIIISPTNSKDEVSGYINSLMTEMGLAINNKHGKYYNNKSNTANFDFLGYEIKVTPEKNKQNKVALTISKKKACKIKTRIATSLSDYKKTKNLHLLKRRLEFLSMLKVVKRGKNGDLLAGLAHNYQYVTDDFDCLKKIDGFLCHELSNPRYELTLNEQNLLRKISIYGNTKRRKIGKFSKLQTINIMRAWANV